MSGWTKLFASITESSIWCTDSDTLRVWVALLARSNADGVVEGSVPGFASLCRMSVEDFENRIALLSAPDPYSRTPDKEGRRIEAVPGGWKIVNYQAYRERGQAKDGSRAPYFRQYRKTKSETPVACNNSQQSAVARNTDAEERGEKQESEGEDTGTSNHRMTKPTFEQIRLQCIKIGVPEEEAEMFMAHHEARGWILGKVPMKSWTAALRTWKCNMGKFSTNNTFKATKTKLSGPTFGSL